MTDIDNSVRLGIFRDRDVLGAARDNFGSLVVPAHIAAYSGDGLWGFLSGLTGGKANESCPFWYDPMTYYIELETQYWFRGSEVGQGPRGALPATNDAEIRPAFRALLEKYGLLDAVRTKDAEGVRAEFLAEGAEKCLAFQRSGVGPKTGKAVAKYARLLDLDLESQTYWPSRLVAPYLAITSWDGRGAEDQANLNRQALDLAGDDEIWAVLALESRGAVRPPTSAEQRELLLPSFSGVGLWLSGLDEYDATEAQLTAYARLIGALSQPVWVMYGGYFALLCAPDGVSDVSHGVYYTESKRLRGPVGSGPPAERYYIPKLHRFFEPGRALDLVGQVPNLRCSCRECGSLDALRGELLMASRSPERRMKWVRRLQRHFLYARAEEVNAVRTTDRRSLVDEMRATIDETSTLLTEARRSTGHLITWVEVFSKLDS